MRLDRAAIALQPRSIGSCIDFALAFFGRRVAPCLAIVACFAVPAGFAAYRAARTSHGLMWAVAIICVATAPLGVCLVAAATRLAFDERWSMRQVLWEGLWRQPKATWVTCLLHPLEAGLSLGCLAFVTTETPPVGAWLLIICAGVAMLPGIAIAVYLGFMAESGVLKPWRRQKHDHRTKDLVRQEYSDLFARSMVLWLFGVMLWGIVTVTADFASTLLFGVPLIFGRIAEALHTPWGAPDTEQLSDAFLQFCVSDPVALCTMTVTALVTYAICRLAWFFAYVDLRIRRDCWDLEVALAEEARRWEGPA